MRAIAINTYILMMLFAHLIQGVGTRRLSMEQKLTILNYIFRMVGDPDRIKDTSLYITNG